MSGERKVSPAPDWRPGPSAPRAVLVQRACDTGLPMPVRVQAALELRVHHQPGLPVLPVGDAGARGPARGPVERATVRVGGYWSGSDDWRELPAEVARVRRGAGMRALSLGQQETAAAYAALVERIGSIRGPADGVRGGAVSDGGMVARCADAERLARVRAEIGVGAVDLPMRGQADRPRGRPVPLLELVDSVCLGGLSLDAVLHRHGWPTARRARTALGEALRAAVDRMASVLG